MFLTFAERDGLAHYTENVLDQQQAELQRPGGAGLDHEVNLGMGVHTPLREGDVLALAGSRDNLLAARWVD